MQYVAYGKTNKNVSIVGFGGLRFDLSKTNEENAKLVEYAYHKGINYFDTAPGYCDDRSEDILGIAFRNLQEKGHTNFYVSTKGKPLVYDTSEKAEKAVKLSLSRLGVSKIDFYHVWCLRNDEQYDLAMAPGGQMEGLLKCKDAGLIDHIVFSSHQRGDSVRTVLNEGKFEGVTMGINLLNFPYRWDSVQFAKEKGYGIVAMNPLSGGTIPENEAALSYLTDGKETVTHLALRFNIKHPDITISLIGFSSNEEIDAACQIADDASEFTEEERNLVIKRLGDSVEGICTACGYCKACPVEINIPGYMLFYNDKSLLGVSDEEMKARVYGLEYWNYSANSKNKADACIACGRCEQECTQHLPIISRLKEIGRWENESENFVTV